MVVSVPHLEHLFNKQHILWQVGLLAVLKQLWLSSKITIEPFNSNFISFVNDFRHNASLTPTNKAIYLGSVEEAERDFYFIVLRELNNLQTFEINKYPVVLLLQSHQINQIQHTP